MINDKTERDRNENRMKALGWVVNEVDAIYNTCK